MEHLQIGKQIGKLLDMPKRPQAQKHIFCDFGHLKVQKIDVVDYVRNEAMLVLVFISFRRNKIFAQNIGKTSFWNKCMFLTKPLR